MINVSCAGGHRDWATFREVNLGMMCSLEAEAPNKFVPHGSLASCGVGRSDAQLTRVCRSRRRMDGAEAPAPTWACPKGPPVQAEVDSRLGKYFERVQDQNGCSSSRGMWREAMADEHKCVLVSVPREQTGERGQHTGGEASSRWWLSCTTRSNAMFVHSGKEQFFLDRARSLND